MICQRDVVEDASVNVGSTRPVLFDDTRQHVGSNEEARECPHEAGLMEKRGRPCGEGAADQAAQEATTAE